MKLRRFFYTLALLLTFTVAASAQEPISLQARAGVGVSKLQGLSLMDFTLSYKLGLLVDVPFSEQWALQPALYFVQKGASFPGYYGRDQLVPVTLNNHLSYFELPVYAAFKIALGDASELTLKAGPYAALGIVGKAHVSADDMDFHRTFVGELFTDGCDYDGITVLSTQSGTTYRAGSDKYKKFDAGIAFGADFRYRHYVVGVDCSWGLLPVADGIFENVSLTGDLKNLSAHLTLGYQF